MIKNSEVKKTMRLFAIEYCNPILIYSLDICNFFCEIIKITGGVMIKTLKANLTVVLFLIIIVFTAHIINAQTQKNYPKSNLIPNTVEIFTDNALSATSFVDSNVTLLGRLTTGKCQVVTAHNNMVYFNKGNYLEIADASQSFTPPKLLGELLLSSEPNALTVNGNYLYVADGSDGLRIIDVGNPTAPIEIGFFKTDGFVRDVFVKGTYAYVADDWKGFRIIDISNPSSPSQVGYLDTEGTAMSVFVVDNMAYIADNSGGLRIINIQNPSSPSEVGYFETKGSAVDVFVQDNFAYVVDVMYGLRIIDISNPFNPKETGSFNSSGTPNGVYVSGDYAFLAYAQAGIFVVDISNPASPNEVDFVRMNDGAEDISVDGEVAFVASPWSGLRVLYAGFPPVSYQTSYIFTNTSAYSVYVKDDYAYIADDKVGLRIVNISNPAHLYEASFSETNLGYGVFVIGESAYLSTNRGLSKIDISSPMYPYSEGLSEVWHKAWDVFVSGDYAYVAEGEKGLRIFDKRVENSNLLEVGFFDTDGNASGVYVNGNYAFVADGSDGLRIINISDPTQPFEIGAFDTEGNTQKVYVSGSYAYIADGDDGLRIIDVSAPSNPFEAGYIDTEGFAQGVKVAGNFAYVADGNNGLRIIDVSNPLVPIEAAFLSNAGIIRNISIKENYVYVAADKDGLYVLRNDLLPDSEGGNLPIGFVLFQNYPNPFSSKEGETTIRYSVPVSDKAAVSGGTSVNYNVQLIVYDILGREVTKLVNETKVPGDYSVQFNVKSGMPSGVYFYRIIANGNDGRRFVQTKKMMLIK